MKKALFVIAVVLIIGALTGTGIFFFQKKNNTTPLPQDMEEKSKLISSTQLLEYEDPSGFTFSYPDNLSLKANEASDSSTYANLVLTTKETDGQLIFTIVDSKLKDARDSFEQSEDLTQVSFGSLKGYQQVTEDSIVFATLDQGVMFTVETKLGDEKDFWTSVFNTISKSFTFAAPSSKTTSTETSSAGGINNDVVFEGEEVIE